MGILVSVPSKSMFIFFFQHSVYEKNMNFLGSTTKTQALREGNLTTALSALRTESRRGVAIETP